VTDWENLLAEAALRVQRVSDRLSSSAERDRVVGTGASGDETLLADREAELELVDSLSSVEGLRIVSEEMGESGPKAAKLTAIIDPIDGSSNFSRGIPFYCTSVCIVAGISLRDSRYALVRDLVGGDVYYAERGKGASKNGVRIRGSPVSDLSEAVAGVDLSRAAPAVVRGLTSVIPNLKRHIHLGANALELCFVADGLLDASLDIRGMARVTDFAAGYLIATEAGAKVTSEAGRSIEPRLDMKSRFSYVAAGNAKLHNLIMKELSAAT